jgi:septum site-determining protein MinC
MYNENFEMKSSFLSVKSVSVRDDNVKEFENYIKRSVIQAPYIFNASPFFIDVSEIKNKDFEEIYEVYKKAEAILVANKMIILGVKDCKKAHKELFQEKGVFVFIDAYNNTPATSKKDNIPEQKENVKTVEKVIEIEKIVEKIINTGEAPMIYEGVVRGGQQIYAEGRDLIIFGHVNIGAEVVAGKNLIVLGSAEGRLIAGLNDSKAVIIAQKFKPSLLSINGNFLTIDEDNNHFGKTVKVKLNENGIDYKEIDL